LDVNILIGLPIEAEKREAIQGGYLLTGSHVSVKLPALPVRYLYSGWQSWSLTSWINIDRPIHRMRPSVFWPMQNDPRYAREKKPNGSWYGAVQLSNGQVFFLGALGLDSHVMLADDMLIGWFEAGGGNWFFTQGDETHFMEQYAKLLNARFASNTKKNPFNSSSYNPSKRVWCSWYSLQTEINENILLKILADMKSITDKMSLPFDIFQVDDGWQKGIGEWEPNDNFSSGMEWLAGRIRETGRKAGLWLAPFLMAPSSSIFHQHPDWLLHNEKGKLVQAGFNWKSKLYALDTTHPCVLEWLTELMHRIRAWGYDYIKIDFLYAGALPGNRHVNIAREVAYRNGLRVIRNALGDAYLLTCGAPILPSLGLCDGIRIGPDVARHFASNRDDLLLQNFAIPGARNALRTVYNRLWLQSLVDTDPDVVYFSSFSHKLTKDQQSHLIDMACICHYKGTSDLPSWLNDHEKSALVEFLQKGSEIYKIGSTQYQIDGRLVDFNSFLALPSPPSFFSNFLGALLGWLANNPLLLQMVDVILKNSFKKRLKRFTI
jgi:alpha-galactosidase